MVAFHDDSRGEITSWRWELGDGSFSSEQHLIHRYAQAGEYVVRLFLEGPAGKAHWTKIRDVVVK
jgi:PKD repeat protein